MVIDNARRIVLTGVKCWTIVKKRLDRTSRLAGTQVSAVVNILGTASADDGDNVVALVVDDDAGSLKRKFAIVLKLRVGGECLVDLDLKLCLNLAVEGGVAP